jgi:hypothetical protein
MGKVGGGWPVNDQGGRMTHRSGAAGRTVGGLEGFIGSMVLVHLDSKVKPGLWVHI